MFKVRLIKRHFCKTTQISLTFLRFQTVESRKICGFHIARPKAKSVSASRGRGALPSNPPDQGFCPWTPLHPFDRHWVRKKYCFPSLCPGFCPPPVSLPQLQIPSPAHDNATFTGFGGLCYSVLRHLKVCCSIPGIWHI